jgi:hypothetical protein
MGYAYYRGIGGLGHTIYRTKDLFASVVGRRCEDVGFILSLRKPTWHPNPCRTSATKEVLRGMKFILSACPIHQGCTIQVVFGKTSERRAPWPDPDLKPIAEREFPGLVLIESEHLDSRLRGALATSAPSPRATPR